MKSKLKLALAIVFLISIVYDVYWFLQGEPTSNMLISIIRCIVYFISAIYFASDFIHQLKNRQ